MASYSPATLLTSPPVFRRLLRLGEEVTGIEIGHLYVVWDGAPCSRAVGAKPVFSKYGLGVDGGFAAFVLIDTSRATLVRVVRTLHMMHGVDVVLTA